MPLATIWKSVNMIYTLFCYLLAILRFGYNVLWFVCILLSAGVPWMFGTMVGCALVAKWVKLKRPQKGSLMLAELATLEELDTDGSESSSSKHLLWPIANRGGDFDAPENSAMALKMCSSKLCRNVLLDLAVTKCGELVILHKSTIHKQKNPGSNSGVHEMTLESMQNFNISEHHPLHNQFPPEKILTLSNLLTLLESIDVVVYLLVSPTTKGSVDIIARAINQNPTFTNRIVVCSNSLSVLYQLRKSCSELVCGLWLDKHSGLVTKCMPMSTLIVSLYRTVLRSFVVPLIGISVAFINKEEYNAYTKQLWCNAAVRPVVYSVNSPNEKQYFQKVLRTQYVTHSLRSEPQLLIANRK